MSNPIFWKKVQGQKHPGRRGIVEHQIPSIKVLFKTNTKGHKHPSIRHLSRSKTQLVNQRKQKVAFSPGTAHSPEIQSYRMWWGAASPILNDTTVVYVYIYIYIIITKNIRYLLWNRGLWRSLNNTHPIFLTPCIQCTNHLCDSCDLTD